MPTPERIAFRRQFAEKVANLPVKVQVGMRGTKVAPDWTAIDLYDTQPDVAHNWDVQNLPLDSNSVDCFMCNAILEHVPHPELAVYEMRRTLKPGGQIWVEVPFLQFYHAHPHDFTRWTMAGTKILMGDFREVGSGICEGATYEVKKYLQYMNLDAKLPVPETLIEQASAYVAERERAWRTPRFYSSVFFWGEKPETPLAEEKAAYMEYLKTTLSAPDAT